ncbi:MAG: S-layer homology domain-containing protein [Firmicutes bacterium]|nr:S-layer homology domain-containing protein [Bacillota bacterium]MDD3298350.1 S-layer homology domain-containing protein [Bacillota bacterium]MDD3850547.1 S-layer homology domain-containing protein [Bacillota bacterium]MDD4707348.1 S-layer homology domain-containing protein [Bacillota bacterium]
MAKGKRLRILSVLLAVLVLAAGMPLSATATRVFTDVGDGEWYDTYVLKAYEAGLISGFQDATFKPNNKISNVEVIVCLARLAGYANDSAVDSYRQKYSSVMSTNKIPTWANGYIAFGLEKGIVTGEELATFIKSDGNSKNALRYQVAVYFARALGLEQEAKSYINLVLNFVDNEIISQWSRGYIKALMDRDIMKGDATNRFNPNNEITRAEVATMLALSLGYAGGVDTGTTSIQGTVKEVGSGTGGTYIKIEVADGGTDIYYTASNVNVKLDGATMYLSSVAVGQTGTFGIKDDKIVSINVTSSTAATEGVVRSVFDGSDYRSITIANDDGDRTTYRVTSSTIIRLDGSTVSLSQISTGDRVSVTASGIDATRVEAERKVKTVLGIFGGLKTEDKLILILKKGTQEIEYEVDDDVDVERDGRRRGIEDLRKGDEIEITLEYGIVTEIEAESQDRDVEGTIYSLLIARPHQLTILNDDGDQETFVVPVDVEIELDGKPASIYDLRLDYIVEVEVESDEVVGIEAESVVSQNEVIGTVEYVNTSVNVITVKVYDASANANITRQVNINDDTRIINQSGTRRYIRHIEVGDRLVVVGHSELGVFIADTIMITNR